MIRYISVAIAKIGRNEIIVISVISALVILVMYYRNNVYEKVDKAFEYSKHFESCQNEMLGLKESLALGQLMVNIHMVDLDAILANNCFSESVQKSK